MRKTIITGIVLALLALIVFNYVMPGCLRQQDKKIKDLESIVNQLTSEVTPLAFRIREREDSTIVVDVKFYDLQMRELSSKTFNLKGTELFFDFSSYKVGDNYLAFPSKLFTNKMAAHDGIMLFDFYSSEHFPQIYYRDSLSESDKNTLKEIFANVRDSSYVDKNSFGSAVHDVAGLKSFELGQVYRVIVHPKGGIEIIED